MARATEPDDEIRRLAEANAALSRFVGQAAHDVQEPLRLLRGYLDLLQLHLEGKAALDAPKLARDAIETADRMQMLVASLLDYTRAANQPLNREPIPLGVALADAAANMRLRIKETGAHVTHGPLPTLVADRGQLTRLFQNLIENSIKYSSNRAPVIHVAAQKAASGWTITVDDNGPGFPKQGRERLFEPFARLHGAQLPGSGLGLASVRSIVERMGGSIEALDNPSGGARVQIQLVAS